MAQQQSSSPRSEQRTSSDRAKARRIRLACRRCQRRKIKVGLMQCLKSIRAVVDVSSSNCDVGGRPLLTISLQCDEGVPRCSACQRAGVECQSGRRTGDEGSISRLYVCMIFESAFVLPDHRATDMREIDRKHLFAHTYSVWKMLSVKGCQTSHLRPYRHSTIDRGHSKVQGRRVWLYSIQTLNDQTSSTTAKFPRHHNQLLTFTLRAIERVEVKMDQHMRSDWFRCQVVRANTWDHQAGLSLPEVFSIVQDAVVAGQAI